MNFTTKTKGRLAAAGTALTLTATAVGISLLGGGAATAAVPQPERQAALPANSVYHSQIVDSVETDLMKTPNGSVYHASLQKKIVDIDNIAPNLAAQIAVGTTQSGSISAPVTIADIGGSIFDPTDGQGATKVAFPEVKLATGHAYNISYSGQAQWKDDSTPTAGVQFQIVPWLDKNGNDVFEANEAIPGAVSATDYLPSRVGRHATAAGGVTLVYTGATDVPVQLGVFGYQDDNGGAASGKVDLTAANLVVQLAR